MPEVFALKFPRGDRGEDPKIVTTIQMLSNQDTRERRRRQNRESQQRRRKRQKWPSEVVGDHGFGCQSGQAIDTAEQNIMHMPATLNLPPSQPHSEDLQRSQALMDCHLVQESSSHAPPSLRSSQQQQYQYQYQQQQQQQQYQNKSHHHAESRVLWPIIGLEFSTTTGCEREGQCKKNNYDRIMESNGDTLSIADDMTLSPAVHYRSPVSMGSLPSRCSTSSQHAIFDRESRYTYPQNSTEHSTMRSNHGVS
ncbi:hypothetical protein E4U55_003374 [Claviceps digitariae]|nr:hypothetical protein E4U55_003374 [Claviceps digitariae]